MIRQIKDAIDSLSTNLSLMASEEIHSKHLTCDDGDEYRKYHKSYDDDDDGSGSPPAEDDSGDDDMELCMFRLSLCDAKLPMFDNEDDPHLNNQYESGDADGELSEKKSGIAEGEDGVSDQSDSDSCTKVDQRFCADLLLGSQRTDPLSKNSDNENAGRERSRGRKGRRRNRETLLEKAWNMKCKSMVMMGCADDVHENNDDNYGDDDGDGIGDDDLSSQERDHHHESMPTTPNSGRCMLMDMDEMKACRDLGFEVKMMSSFSSTDTSSVATSPITNWRISSPGDDPSDVKARLRVWAQVVAAASTARLYN